MFNVSYNEHMPRKSAEGEKKEFQVGFRIVHAQRQRLDALITRIKSEDKRVDSSEIYEELMSLREPEFVTDLDRKFLMGKLVALPETQKNTSGVPKRKIRVSD